jgi:hypothetical protein
VTWQAAFWLAIGLDFLAVARLVRIRGRYQQCRDANRDLLYQVLDHGNSSCS